MNVSDEIKDSQWEEVFVPTECDKQAEAVVASIGDGSTVSGASIVADLNDLANWTFGTRWSDTDSPKTERVFSSRHFNNDRKSHYFHKERSDDRQSKSFNDTHFEQTGPNKLEKYSQERRPFRPRPREYREHRVFSPPFDIQFYPEDKPFDLLVEEMRKNCKTYELFTVAKLILQKPERYVVTIRRRPNAEGVVAPLYLSLLDDLVFESEREAMAHMIHHHVDEFFDVHEEVMEPPKGRFTCVHRCGLTKKLLSAPNYHRYRNILRDHFNAEIYSMPFERFVAKIETTKDEADIQNWLQQMSHKVTYTPKVIDETITDFEPLSSLDGVKNYLLKYYKDRILREVTTVRIAGVNSTSMPPSSIAREIQFILQRQRQFPLDTANNLRNRFRRVDFGIYRRGKSGISYVCAVKRKFRRESDVFESGIQSLISFLEPLAKADLMMLKKDYIEANHLSETEILGMLDWLIREGYVVLYENGELYLNPKLIPMKGAMGDGDIVQSELEEVIELSSTGQLVIPLKMEETAIEKLSDGTITVTPETALGIAEEKLNIEFPHGREGTVNFPPDKERVEL
ncbi:MAG: hypothetical protein LBH08_01130 [Puniceicoccales bacterium]|jgi:hypothetical protein|nr:hypothetical protein [Puniceicoccales bacterium]